ncbi:hypothetical protein PG985_007801 [Apiospora marii]|uniref:Uncharacterized protein n=1 Tax=Apiospora marii TaxID=335849 RepID=A0ABR1SQ31_9PEZI
MPTEPSTQARIMAANLWVLVALVNFGLILIALSGKIPETAKTWVLRATFATSMFLIGVCVANFLGGWIRAREERMADVQALPTEEKRSDTPHHGSR